VFDLGRLCLSVEGIAILVDSFFDAKNDSATTEGPSPPSSI